MNIGCLDVVRHAMARAAHSEVCPTPSAIPYFSIVIPKISRHKLLETVVASQRWSLHLKDEQGQP